MDDIDTKAIGYKEELPEACPPANAEDAQGLLVYRLVEASVVKPEDFFSHAKLGKVPPASVDLCRWASCSLINVESGFHKVSALRTLPLLRKRNLNFAAKLELTPGAGRLMHSPAGNGHIDFWMAAAFDPVSAVQDVMPIQS